VSGYSGGIYSSLDTLPLNLFNPSYVKKETHFKSAASYVQLFYLSARTGLIRNLFAFISFILAIVIISFNIQQFRQPLTELSTINSILVAINFLFSILIFTMFILVGFIAFSILISNILWLIISYFSPEQPQI
jgi:hypothetical protein